MLVECYCELFVSFSRPSLNFANLSMQIQILSNHFKANMSTNIEISLQLQTGSAIQIRCVEHLKVSGSHKL